jgi:hypothetical protein
VLLLLSDSLLRCHRPDVGRTLHSHSPVATGLGFGCLKVATQEPDGRRK